MKHLVVFAHPRSGSFTRQAAGASVDELEQCGHEVVVRDLYTMGFNPVLSAEEMGGKAPLPEDISGSRSSSGMPTRSPSCSRSGGHRCRPY